MTDDEIRMCWLYMERHWPNYALPTDAESRAVQLLVWQRNLGDVSAEHVQGAIDQLANREFAPPVGVIRDRALDLERSASGVAAAPGWEPAWDEIWRSVRLDGRYAQPLDEAWSHPVVAELVAAFGWQILCDTLTEDLPTVRAQFRDMHGQIAARYDRLTKRPTPAVAAIEEQGRRRALEGPRVPQVGSGGV